MSKDNPPITLPPPKLPANSVRSPNDTLVAHADRLWNSAVHNATRISSRIQIIGGGIVVMIGVSVSIIVGMDKAPDWPRSPVWAYVVGVSLAVVTRGLILAALYYYARAISRLYIRDNESKGMAANLMEFSSADANQPIKLAVFKKTYAAYIELNTRNEKEKSRLRQSQRWFAKGLALMGVAAIVYVVAGVVPKFLPQGNANASHSSTGTTAGSSQ